MTREPDRQPSAGLVAHNIVRIDRASSRRLLDDVSLQLGPQQRAALVGPSGSGKSLLLRVLARLDPVDSGSVQWQAQSIQRDAIPAFRATVMLLLQQPSMAVGTVADQLKLPYGLQHFRRSGKQFDRDAAMTLIQSSGRDETFLAQSAQRLSGGERQLVALIRALLLEPSVLLLDEPTSAMDPPTVAIAQRWIADWFSAADDRSYLWVTHDTAQRQRVADLYWALDAGRVMGPTHNQNPNP